MNEHKFEELHLMLEDMFDGIAFGYGGSVSLTAFGLFQREIGDFDVIFPPNFEPKVIDAIDQKDEEALGSGGENLRFELQDNFFVDVMFKGHKFVEKEVFGVKCNVTDPRLAIHAKGRYIESAIQLFKSGKPLTDRRLKSLHKHIDDVQYFNKKTNGSFKFV